MRPPLLKQPRATRLLRAPLVAIYHATNPSTSTSVTIFIHAHLRLSPYIAGDRSSPDISITLPTQVQAHVEFLDGLVAAYGPETSMLLMGHSVQEMLKLRRPALLCFALTHTSVQFMLFTTVSNITPK
ncbi:hypothetical protein BJY52DRAFT_1185001 [Lactarius psammicola]|nr:hypothetical protein BJY52DRAFT_1185001 [Lactarius psammicola]